MNKTEFYHEKKISDIVNILSEIDDERTVIMAPKMGSSSGKENNKLRIYSHSNEIFRLSTTERAKCEYNNQLIKSDLFGASKTIGYDKLTKENIKLAIDCAMRRANGTKKYNERSVETALVYKNRKCTNLRAIIIDIEFGCPANWIGRANKYELAKPDLVVYDIESKSFGIIELKYNNNSCENMEKHFKDFYDITNSSKDIQEKIKFEFTRKMNYLKHYRIIPNIPENDINTAKQNNIWMAFLFIGGHEKDSGKYFEKRMQYKGIEPNLFGFRHYQSLDYEIDCRKSAFKF